MGLFSFITNPEASYQQNPSTTFGGCTSLEVDGILAAEKAAKKSKENSDKLDNLIQHSLDIKQELSSQRIAIDNILQRLDAIEDVLRKDQTLKNNF